MLLRLPTLAALVALAVPSIASASPRFTPTGDAIGPVRTDGVRYAAYEPTPGVTRVLDTRLGTQFEVATPCDVRYRSDPVFIGGGTLMWGCFPDSEGPMVLDIASRVVSRAAKPTAPFPSVYGEIEEIGARWIFHRVDNEVLKGRYQTVTDWRTGRTLREPGSKADALDLDAPDLIRRMCDPLRRTLARTGPRAYAPYQYEPPYGLRIRRGALVLERCGAKRTLLSKKPKDGYIAGARLAGGVATWLDGTEYLRVFLASSARRMAVRLPRRRSAAPLAADRTLTRVFASVPVKLPNGVAQPYGRWKLYSTPWRPLARAR